MPVADGASGQRHGRRQQHSTLSALASRAACSARGIVPNRRQDITVDISLEYVLIAICFCEKKWRAVAYVAGRYEA
jgi:hypothetical protein